MALDGKCWITQLRKLQRSTKLNTDIFQFSKPLQDFTNNNDDPNNEI